MLRHQICPDSYMAIFDSGQTTIDVLLVRILLRLSQQPIKKRSVGFVLPMMLESVEVDAVPVGFRRGWLECGGHRRNIAGVD